MAEHEFTHVLQAKGKAGDWKSMTKHTSHADAKSALSDAKTATKGKGEFRIAPYGSSKPAVTKTAAKPAAKPAAKAVGASKPVKKVK